MATCVSKKDARAVTFEFERGFADSNFEKLLPDEFFLQTETDNVSYAWKIRYKIVEKRVNDVRFLEIREIEFTAIKKPEDGDVVSVEIFLDQFLLVKCEFNQYLPSSLTMQLKKNINTDSILTVKIQVMHRLDGVPVAKANYQQVLQDERLCDVTFICGKKKFFALAAVLKAHSPVFKAMLETDMKEKKNGRIKITDIEPKIFRRLLDFLNFGSVPSDTNYGDLLQLLVAADKYSLNSLSEVCERRLLIRLTTDNVVDILEVADRIHAVKLKNSCMEFILANKQKFSESREYERMRRSLSVDTLNYFFQKWN